MVKRQIDIWFRGRCSDEEGNARFGEADGKDDATPASAYG
jgi:hypothetical protein